LKEKEKEKEVEFRIKEESCREGRVESRSRRRIKK